MKTLIRYFLTLLIFIPLWVFFMWVDETHHELNEYQLYIKMVLYVGIIRYARDLLNIADSYGKNN